MKWELNKNSLFAILLRSPWWVSALAAIGLVIGMRLLIPTSYAVFVALPFAVIAAYVGWQQLRAPSAKRVAGTLERLRAMSWEDFSAAIEEAYRREGYTVSRLGGAQADFELVQGSRSTLVACKRWKATRTGIEPLRELEVIRRAREAHGCIYVAAGEITEQAREFAAQKSIRLVQGAELAKLLPR
jgi:restriction system protein